MGAPLAAPNVRSGLRARVQPLVPPACPTGRVDSCSAECWRGLQRDLTCTRHQTAHAVALIALRRLSCAEHATANADAVERRPQ